MNGSRLDPTVATFLARHIRSVGELEVLLLLHHTPHRTWTPEQVAAELRTNDAAAATQLAKLVGSGLLKKDEASPAFRYDPDEPELTPVIEHLARLYPTWRTAVISTIYDQSLRSISAFSEAFDMRKRDDRG